MPRKGENIYKRKDGRWEGRYIKGHLGGKAQYGAVFAKSYTDVRKKLNVAKYNAQKLELKTQSAADLTEKPDVSCSYNENFSEIALSWFEAAKPQWKKSSASKFTNTLKLHLIPAFGDREITEITYDEVYAFGNELLTCGGKDGNGLSSKTVNGILSVMKNIFDFAERTKALNVANIRSISFKEQQKPIRTFTLFEQQKLNEYLYGNLDCCNLGILLCLYTGLRIGEICALKWEDISFSEQYIYVHQTIQRLQCFPDSGCKTEIVIAPPKSDCSIRKVPIPENIFGLLKVHCGYKASYILSDTIHYVEPRTLQYRFKKVLDECNIESACFHTLRHTFATRCVELGFDIKSLSEILGHSSVNITLNRYVHPSMDLKQRNMNMLSELFAVK